MTKTTQKFRTDVIMKSYKKALECDDGSMITITEGLALIICMLTNIYEDQKSNPDERAQQLRKDINIFLKSKEIEIIGRQFVLSEREKLPKDIIN